MVGERVVCESNISHDSFSIRLELFLFIVKNLIHKGDLMIHESLLEIQGLFRHLDRFMNIHEYSMNLKTCLCSQYTGILQSTKSSVDLYTNSSF
jgi:hypothetical protein